MDMTQIDMVQFAVGIAVGLVIAAAVWLIVRRSGRKEIKELRQNLQTEIERRSAAEAKLSEIPKLESIVTQRDRAIALFQDERTEHIARIAELETNLTNEQNNVAEKLAVLNDAQKNLTKALTVMSVLAAHFENNQHGKLENTSHIGDSAHE